jgi:hypothetical protein
MQIIFTFETSFGSFCDALNLPDDHGLTDEQLEAMKQERLTNWLAMINPSPEQIEAARLQELAVEEVSVEPTEEA